MRDFLFVLISALLYLGIESKVSPKDGKLITDEAQGIVYLNETNIILGEQRRKLTEAEWSYNTNITNQTSAAYLTALGEFSEFQKINRLKLKNMTGVDLANIIKDSLKSWLLSELQPWKERMKKTFTKVSNEMEVTYSTARVCVDGRCNLELDPDLTEIMANSKSYSELQEAWVNWRDATGKKMRDNYITYYTLGNKAATLNSIPNQSFKTLDELWLFVWETPDIKEQTANLWEKLKPFYEKLHAYVRMKLDKAFPGKMPKDGTIPAHLLGNMWAQQWSNIMNTVPGVDPYPEVEPIDVTPALVEKGYNATSMFELSDKFFGDLGLEIMTDIFWKKSVIVKPTDGTEMVCHASAWDFYTKDDFRIKQCTKVNMEDLITIHHEMGHIEYFMQYQDQPVVYRDGANPGFHEAIGDLLALSVSTPEHLKTFLPFGYIMDKWRWDVFSGNASQNDLNRHWWELRLQYQGLSPPVKRSENDFDPGAKFHIPASVEYIRYFVSHILQFQFHKALCDIAQPGVPVYECDINGNRTAGDKLKEMLQLGSSQKWPQQLKIVTGTDKMDVGPLLDYFKPLEEYLDQVLVNESIGWKATVDDYFGSSDNGSNIRRNADIFSLLLCAILLLLFRI